ncbi:hypothetical protein Skr01_57040 [Sphaerisporangium krabiense]|nr:hypothetical protein Skr01_57040 [Sphaerisporangium krabiense]
MNTDDDTGTVTKAGYMKKDPYNDCARAGYVNVGTRLYYWCFTFNAYGHAWTYARVAGTGNEGWLPEGYLSDGGSTVNCGWLPAAPKLPASLMQQR